VNEDQVAKVVKAWGLNCLSIVGHSPGDFCFIAIGNWKLSAVLVALMSIKRIALGFKHYTRRLFMLLSDSVPRWTIRSWQLREEGLFIQ
jgi:hypothetical protein